ncbi:uncharacterized protein JCM15063_001922 [Sporobolomyces koalae]|uniref:uncharacterized protein n=1 Tax=Sporobolomyces koalae TaxID=500713 RepID=UPI0031802CD7
MPPKAAKASASTDAPQSYKESDIVLAKVKGFPAWPARVVDSASASKKVAKEKPLKAKNVYLVQFFPTGDFAWLQPRDLSTLSSKEIDAYVSGGGKKKGDLLQGYKIAQDPSEWISTKESEASALEQAEQDAEDDQLASDTEGATKNGKGKKDATKKRKRETAANGKKDDKKKPKKDTTKTKAGVKKDYTDDEAEPASKKSKAADSDAETVKGWRHKLQKVFLGKTNPPAEEMSKCAEIFDAMEKFEMKKEWLVESKLAKVLKRVAILKEDVIPDDDKYNFRKRSADLAGKWAAILDGGNAAGSPQPEATPAADNAETNKESNEAAPEADKEETAQEPEAAPAAEAPAAEEKEEAAPMDVDTNGEAKADETKAGDEAKKDEA